MRWSLFAFFGVRFLGGMERLRQRRKNLGVLVEGKKISQACPHCGTPVGVVDGIAFCGTCRTRVELPEHE